LNKEADRTVLHSSREVYFT